MMSNLRGRNPMYSSSLQPTFTSSTGGADSETRIVSPMPSASSAPNARQLLIVPCQVGPASVTPKCSGQSPLEANRRYVCTMVTTSWCLTEILKSWKPTSSNMRASFIADATSASGVGPPYLAYSSLSSEPAFTPMRRKCPHPWRPCRSKGRPRRICECCRGSRARPRSRRRWPGTRTCFGSGCRQSPESAIFDDFRQCVGIILAWHGHYRTISQPAAVSSAICCRVAGTSAVSVLVMDCTEIGAPRRPAPGRP